MISHLTKMSSSEKFCLKWNDFEANVSCAFRELREDKDFFDVTLACDDEQIQAHKVIVSACSPFFRNVLRRNPHQHPLLYLKGVKYREGTRVQQVYPAPLMTNTVMFVVVGSPQLHVPGRGQSTHLNSPPSIL